MGCRSRVLSEEEGAFSDSFSDALLFTTLCIIGLPVDVHVKDGSIYSGIFHTACVENDYAIVLKKAKMTRNGNCVLNVPNDSQIETLIVTSDNLVQVIAKGVVLPAMDGVCRNVAGDCTGAVAGTVASVNCSEMEPELSKSSHSHVNMNHISEKRSSALVENGFALCSSSKAISSLKDSLGVGNGKLDGMDPAKKEGAFTGPVNERQTRDGRLQGKQEDYGDDFRKEQTMLQRDDIQSSCSSLDACGNQAKAVKTLDAKITGAVLPNIGLCDNSASSIKKIDNHVQCHQKRSPENNLSSDAISPVVSTSVASVMDVTSEQCFSLSSADNPIPPKTASSFRTAKESKLNPGAKIFSPSFAHHRLTNPPVVPTIAGVTYLPDNCSVVPIATAQPEVESSPFVPCSAFPVKFVPYGNIVAGNAGSDMQYSQPIVGHMGNRAQSVRYAGQHHPVQVGAAYAHQNNQNVMIGRASPLVYVHPVSNGVIQNAAAVSQVSMHPLRMPHQAHLSKQQGNGSAPALQLYIAPPFLSNNGQQTFVMPNQIPISPPPFPAIHPNPITGSHGLLGSKFT